MLCRFILFILLIALTARAEDKDIDLNEVMGDIATDINTAAHCSNDPVDVTGYVKFAQDHHVRPEIIEDIRGAWESGLQSRKEIAKERGLTEEQSMKRMCFGIIYGKYMSIYGSLEKQIRDPIGYINNIISIYKR